jgi:hypothetical protein
MTILFLSEVHDLLNNLPDSGDALASLELEALIEDIDIDCLKVLAIALIKEHPTGAGSARGRATCLMGPVSRAMASSALCPTIHSATLPTVSGG